MQQTQQNAAQQIAANNRPENAERVLAIDNVLRAGSPLYFLAFKESTVPYRSSDVVYAHNLYGRLEDGRAVVLTLEDIPIYYDIKIGQLEPRDVMDKGAACGLSADMVRAFNSADINEYELCNSVELLEYARLRFASEWSTMFSTIKNIDISYLRVERMLRFNFHKFSKYPMYIMRVYYPNPKMRSNSLKFMAEMVRMSAGKYEVYTDEAKFNISSVIREYNISIANWNVLVDYKVISNTATRVVLTCSIQSIVRAPQYDNRYPYVKAKEYIMRGIGLDQDAARVAGFAPVYSDSIINSSLVVLDYDLETYTHRLDDTGSHKIPLPSEDGDEICMFGAGFRLSHTATPFLRVCILIGKYPPASEALGGADSDIRIISVSCERDLLINMIFLLDLYKPDIVNGFNSGVYDLPFIVNKCFKHRLLPVFKIALDKTSAPGYVCNNPAECIKRYASTDSNMSINQFHNKQISVKIGGASGMVSISNFVAPGVMCIDTMIIMRKFNPMTEKWGLNFFLGELKLESKKEMPYHVLFKLFDVVYAENRRQVYVTNNTARSDTAVIHDYNKVSGDIIASYDMGHAISYCVRDSVACGEIWRKAKILETMRAKADTAFVTLEHAFNRADGDKCRQLMYTVGMKTHIFKMQKDADAVDYGKFPGGLVLDPKVVGLLLAALDELDVGSLYPSIMITFNICNSRLIESAEEAEYLTGLGLDLAHQSFVVGTTEIHAWYVRYPSTLYGGEGTKCMGILPTILKYLFDKRKQMKVTLGVCKKEVAALSIALEKNANGAELNSAELTLIDRRDIIEFNMSSCDALQNALKVYMNTFYGESGNSLSANYNVRIAASVTTWGSKLIQQVHRLSIAEGYTNYYGDTDSVYIGPPIRVLAPIEMKYELGESNFLSYMTEHASAASRAADELRDKINLAFIEWTGERQLAMSHDTTGSPAFMACKKKYAYLLQDERAPKFDYSEFWDAVYKIKGIDFIKRGRTSLLKAAGEHILHKMFNCEYIANYLDTVIAADWALEAASRGSLSELSCRVGVIGSGESRLMSVRESMADVRARGECVIECAAGYGGVGDHVRIRRVPRSGDVWYLPREVVVDELRAIIGHSTKDISAFIKTAVYKPDKKNPSVKSYVAKLKSRGDPLPESGVRFEYVVVIPTVRHTVRGTNKKMNLGDRWESPEYVIAHRLSIDINYYLKSEFTGVLARFLTYMFPSPSDLESLKQANKYIAGLINDQTHDKELIQAQRDLWKAKYKYIRERISGLLATNGGVRFTLTQIEMLIKSVRLHASVDTTKRAIDVAPIELAADNEADMLDEINREDMLSMRSNTDRLIAAGKNSADCEGDDDDDYDEAGGVEGGSDDTDVILSEDIEREAAEELERLMNIDAACANNTAYIKQFKNMFVLGTYEPTEQVLIVEREELAHMTTYYKYYEMLMYDITTKHYDRFMGMCKTCNRPNIGSKYLIDMCEGIQGILNTATAAKCVSESHAEVVTFMRCHMNKITGTQSNVYANNLNIANRQLSELKAALFTKDAGVYLVDELITNTFDSYSINTSTAEIDAWFSANVAMMSRWVAGISEYIGIIDQIVKQLVVVNKNKYVYVKIFREKAYKKEVSVASK